MPLCRLHQALVNTCRYCQAAGAGVKPPPGPVCPIHATPHTTFCPKCRGSVGGKVVTPAKIKSLRRVTRERERNRKRKPMNGGNET